MTRKTVLIGGGKGLIGRRLCAQLRDLGHDVRVLTRTPGVGAPNEFRWDISQNLIDPKAFENVDWVINLAGESVTRRPWTKRFRKAMFESRIETNRLLIDTLIERKQNIETYISASAVGYYGDRGDELLCEDSSVGDTYLSQLCSAWETSADRATSCAQKVSKVRIGIVLAPGEGPLKKLVTPQRFGVFPYLGAGDNHLAWIHIDDLVNVFLHLLTTPYFGVYNACSPQTVTARRISEILADLLGGQTVSVPAVLVETLLGDMSSLLLHSTNVEPAALLESHFDFEYANLTDALKDCLNV